MESIVPVLQTTARDLEARIKPQLDGFTGMFLRSYLPQAWVFQVENEVASLVVDPTGSVKVVASAAPSPDVTIEIPRARLIVALTERNAAKVPPGPLKVTPHTAKGRTAFDFLRRRLGL